MKTLANLTLHRQEEREIALAARDSYALDAEPSGVDVGEGTAGLERAVRLLADRLEECSRHQTAALVGGHTGLWIAAVDRLPARGVPRPELLYFDTARLRDESGRFVFSPRRLVHLWPAPPPVPRHAVPSAL
jgi:hypothetical protein